MRRRSGLEDFDVQAVELEGFADCGHAANPSQHVAADRLEAFRLDCDVEAVAHLVDARLRAEDPRSVPFVDNGLALDIVFISDLADDLLEQVFEGHETRRAAVLVDDDGHLRLPALEFLEELRHPFGLGNEHRRTDEWRDRLLTSVRLGQYTRSFTKTMPRMLSRSL